MKTAGSEHPGKIRLKLPATSANLGSGFDTAAIALDFYLEIEAEPAAAYSIEATGRDAARCSRLEDNLILGVYRRFLAEGGKPEIPIAVKMTNGIPLGMGCGSSAAGRLAGLVLADHFGALGWPSEKILEEATALEGHPDNAAACWLGGFVAGACEGKHVRVARTAAPEDWRAIVVLPPRPLATSKARALLPATYPRADAVANIQAAALLGFAFGQQRADLVHAAMKDRIHQPYREAVCPLLPRLLPLAGKDGILGVALSGAGPAVLAVVDGEASIAQASEAIRKAQADLESSELLVCRFGQAGAQSLLERAGTLG